MPLNNLINDPALSTAQRALDGLSLQQQVISRNIANVDTPGYQAQTVDFESALQKAQNQSGSLGLTTTNSRQIGLADLTSSAPAQLMMRPGGTQRADGNDVNIDDEMLDMSTVGIQYQALTELASQKLALLQAIAGVH